jgi:2-oxoisovalerate ferredoxin oxidoreductase beta subunit
VHVSADEVLSPASPHPRILVAFNAPSLAKFAPDVPPGGTILYDSSVVKDPPPFPAGVGAFGVPFTEIAVDLGKAMVKNIVALGALQAATKLFPEETFRTAFRLALKDKCAMIPLNEEAFSWGIRAVPPPAS